MSRFIEVASEGEAIEPFFDKGWTDGLLMRHKTYAETITNIYILEIINSLISSLAISSLAR